MIKILTYTFIAIGLLPFNLFGQLYHTDPYKLSFYYLEYNLKKNEVVQHKVEKISSFECEHKKNGKIKKNKVLVDFTEFNEFGNPTYYEYKYVMPCWWWPTLKQKLRLEKEITTTYQYSFQYDSLQNLIHVQEKIFESHSSSHDEIDVFYYYDHYNNLVKQAIYDKLIYKPNYKYRGVSYKNDTSYKEHNISYNDNQNVTFIDTYIKNNEEQIFDTLSYEFDLNYTFDSLFVKKTFDKDIKKDSLGRITQYIIHKNTAKSIDGYPISIDSPYDDVVTIFYNENGKLFKTEFHNRSGTFVKRIIYKYDNKGFLTSIQQENSNPITIYEYQYY